MLISLYMKKYVLVNLTTTYNKIVLNFIMTLKWEKLMVPTVEYACIINIVYSILKWCVLSLVPIQY